MPEAWIEAYGIVVYRCPNKTHHDLQVCMNEHSNSEEWGDSIEEEDEEQDVVEVCIIFSTIRLLNRKANAYHGITGQSLKEEDV